jgi:hypothetical protein
MNLAAIPNVWLLILNCCEGAKVNAGMASLTYSLVAGGVSAAIGMLERVNVAAANEFSGAIYPALFNYLGDRLQAVQPGQVVELEWVDALYDARSAVRDKYQDAADDRSWALPALYVAREALQVQCGPREDDHRRSYEVTVAGFIQTQPAYMRAYLRQYFEDIVAGRPVPSPPSPPESNG